MLSLIDVPAGTIALRDDRFGRRWEVELAAYRLARYPVTAGLHRAITGIDSETADLPLTTVSWYDAVEFCTALSADAGLPPAYSTDAAGEVECDWSSPGYRLPTEAEWQYACTSGVPSYRYGPLDEIAWYAGNSGGRRHPVGLKSPNPWGFHDLLGNVWEWCWDLYDPATYGSYRIFRGAGFDDPERACGSTVRRRSHPTFAIDDLGFRVAQSVTDHGRSAIFPTVARASISARAFGPSARS